MEIAYTWRGDGHYYATVVDRYYRQASPVLRLGAQAAMVWVMVSAIVLVSNVDFASKCSWLVVAAALGFAFPPLVKHGIVLKYRLRPTFGAEATFRMTDTEILIDGPGSGRHPWTVYNRAVSFTDGLLLVRKGGVRWLPHAALTEGTPAEAVAVVQSHLPTRVLA